MLLGCCIEYLLFSSFYFADSQSKRNFEEFLDRAICSSWTGKLKIEDSAEYVVFIFYSMYSVSILVVAL